MTDGKQKLVFMLTHGPENPERATIPFAIATTALAMDIDVLLGLQVDAVFLARKGTADQVTAHGFPPLKDLLAAYLGSGGKIYVCAPCLTSRGIAPEELVEGATVVGGATFVAEFTAATNVLVY